MQRFAAICLLLSTVAASAQTGLRINEVNTGTTDYIEVANLGPDIVYMQGYQVSWGCNTGAGPTFVSGIYTFPVGVVLYPGRSAILTEVASATLPAVPLGTFRAYIGATIPWATMPLGTPATERNGIACLISPFGVGLDRVQWGTPTTSFDSIAFGAVFTGVVNITLAAAQRSSNADTDLPADWVSHVTGTPGNLTPAGPGVTGETIIIGLTMSLTTSGGGQLTLTTTTQNPAMPGGEIYNLISLQNFVPNGTGPIFGVGTDVIQLAVTPASPTNPFHTFVDGAGVFSLNLPAGILPPGLLLEGVALAIAGGTVSRISTVVQVVL
jgi:hypothetical protein